MSASKFAKLIISKLDTSISKDPYSYTEITPNIANKAIAEAVTEYLLDNTKISISYSGIIPEVPPVPDPVVSDIIPITGKCSPPNGTDFNIWIKSLELNIVSGFYVHGPGENGITPTTPIPSFIPGIKLIKSNLTGCHNNNLEDPQQPVWEVICQGIMDWLNMTLNSGITYPAINSNSNSSGTATIIKTIVL